ncbi:M81 family metallopeptidase [Achromobacter anxifer]|jgi:microcystin degradation protein MlrC|uniref:M81 family metallopeptidase n=1 Tax=Achromobacter anxifer TaxID=1287737 RepID=UPI0023F8E7FA|nr:M81 family metallopeptidase [Achromobacter anxifer]MDF8360336.1 M81 family metallopeptidase [Achromobacter anxifer]
MRVFTGSLSTETNTFAPLPTSLDDFADRGYYPAGTHPPEMTIFSGPLWAARQRGAQHGWTVIEGMAAGAQPGGITTRHAYETLREELLEDLRMALPVDMVVLGLHGAMVADGYEDCEGDLLARIRAIVGPDVVVGAELDPHCHLSDAMVGNADMLVAYKEYPHTDIRERALELVDFCAAIVERRIAPVAAVADCEMVVTIRTPQEPARSYIDRITALEGQNGILSVSVIHSFAWGDVPDMGTKLLVYADGDAQAAQTLARQLADELIGMREVLTPVYPKPDEAIDLALAHDATPVVIADASDNPGGGGAGDSTFLLRRLRERGVRNAAIGPMWDPVAVRIAFSAGVGARLPLRIGGKISPLSGEPVDLMCTVKALVPDMVMTGLSGSPAVVGNSALIEADGIEIVLITVRAQALDTDVFTQLGCQLEEKALIVVKSAQHFQASFSKVARHVIYADAPGSAALDLKGLQFEHIHRPKWPMDM